MELDGNEKRIRALFSELSLQDQSHAPRFESLWRRAENSGTTGAAQVRRVSGSATVVALAGVIFVVACVLAVWSWSTASTKPPAQNAVNVAPRLTSPVPAPTLRESVNSTVPTDRPRSHPRRKRSGERPRTTEWATTQAETLSRWQSPTKILMTSPTGEVFNSLPQLNQSAEELKQFLTNDAIKESNQ